MMRKQLSKLFKSTSSFNKNLFALPLTYAFHSGQKFNRKLGIGEATVALEEKISKISQLVYIYI